MKGLLAILFTLIIAGCTSVNDGLKTFNEGMSSLNKPLFLCLRISSGGPLAVAGCGWGAVKKKKKNNNLRALKDKAEKETAQTMRKPGAHYPHCS